MMTNPYRAYMETEVNTSNKGRLVLMLYNGAIKFINEAKIALNQGQLENTHNKIMRAFDIVSELRFSLDESAGEISHNLDKLYEFVNDRLVQGNIHKSSKELDEALDVLSVLREAWVEIVKVPVASPQRAQV